MTYHAPSFDFPALLGDMTAQFADGIRATALEAEVAGCPGWQVRDLVGHLGAIHDWATAILAHGERARFEQPVLDVRTAEDAAQWYADRAARLCAAVADLDAEAPCWNFSGVQQWRGFWPRRQVHETRIHLRDLLVAGGPGRPGGAGAPRLDPALSGDGVQEVFQVFYPRQAARGHAVDLPQPLRVVATDLGMSWLLVPDGDVGARLAPRGGPPPVARVEGSAADVLLVLWGRSTPSILSGEGDEETIRRFLASSHTP